MTLRRPLLLLVLCAAGCGQGGLPGAVAGEPTGLADTPADNDFAARAGAPGVVRALGFDSRDEWLDHVFDRSNCNPDYKPGCRSNAWDRDVKASGAGSVRFDILSNSASGSAGQLAVNFTEDYSRQFGANGEFWLQWRQRFDRYMIEHDYRERSGSGGEWKQVIIAQGDRRRADGSVLVANACSEAQIVVVNSWARRYPSAYIECGRYEGFDLKLPSRAITHQNQRVDGRGRHTCTHHGGEPVTEGCLGYHPDEWMTFMVHVKMGPEGDAKSSASGRVQRGLVDSTYELYVARDGEPLQLAHRQEGLVIPRGQHWDATRGKDPDAVDDPGYRGGWNARDGHPRAEFGKVWLLPYHTDKDKSEVHEKASTWYDELIISTQPIAAPGGAAGEAGLPVAAAPQGRP